MQKVIVRSVCLLGVFFAGSLAASAQSGAGESLDGCTDCGGSVTWLESVPEESLASDAGCASILTRPRLTGDWHGYRTAMEECGVTFAGRSTHFAFGLGGGINAPVPSPLDQGDTFEYTGRGEYDLIFDLGKLGGLPGGSLLIRAEHWYGEFGNVGLRTGAFTPPSRLRLSPHSPATRARCSSPTSCSPSRLRYSSALDSSVNSPHVYTAMVKRGLEWPRRRWATCTETPARSRSVAN